jgi:hypothetical protein
VTPDLLSRTIEGFLAGSCDAIVTENGETAFDLAQAKYSISGEYNKCLLHLWSAERNVVRRVLDLEIKNDVMRLAVQRLGQTKPAKLEICRERDRRTPIAKRAARVAYRRKLQRIMERHFPGYTVAELRISTDLERSFGPIYARGLIRKGQSAYAVLGVNDEEAQVSIDAALAFGILWLDLCRQTHADKLAVQGLKIVVPAGCSRLTRERMGHLNQAAAKWALHEFDEREDMLVEVDISDRGNLATRLVHLASETAACERFGQSISLVRNLIPEAAIAVLSAAEIAFRHRGLEFARARLAQGPASLRTQHEIVFGLGAAERVLDERTHAAFVQLVRTIGEVRHPEGPRDHLLWRLHPERWLESLVFQNAGTLDERLDPVVKYSQVPAFSASDRAMIDVLSVTREGRLAVIELKADEDIHLPLQGLDYWSRVEWHHSRGEFQRFGYFRGRELSAETPLLFLVAPALRVHPTTDTLLRYISPAIDWTLLGIDERWREKVRVIFRKRPSREPREFRVA